MGEPRFEREFLEIAGNYYINLKPYAFQCPACDHVQLLGPCPSCDRPAYESGQGSSGALGVFCKGCGKGLTVWKCPQCGVESAVAKVFGTYEKSMCFVATAAFGDPLAPEVVSLREYRDRVLTGSPWGRRLIRLYYAASPPVARIVASSPALAGLTRAFLRLLANALKHG